jgi:DNA-binding NarL/FixJ family response regulator
VDLEERDLTVDDFDGVDIVLMGCHQNGRSLLNQVEKVNRLSGGKPVVILSSIGRPPTMHDALAAGANGMVNSPFRARELLSALEHTMVLKD